MQHIKKSHGDLTSDVFEMNSIRVCTNGQGIMRGTMKLKIDMNEERVKRVL